MKALTQPLRSIFFTALTLIGISQQAVASDTENDSNDWQQQMQQMSKNISELIPYTYSHSAFHDASNHEKIQSAILSLKSAISGASSRKAGLITSKDPLMNSSLTQLTLDLKLAEESFKEGDLEYARALIQGAVHHCFRCHSSSQFGPEFMKPATVDKSVQLTLNEQADLYVATREYEKALKVLGKKLSGPKSAFEGKYETEQALKKYLAIAVRIKKTPKRAIETINKLLTEREIPIYLKDDLNEWAHSLSMWLKEKPKKLSLEQAKALIETGNQMQIEHGFQRGYIQYLRGSSILHELLLSSNLTSLERSETLLALGQSYEVLFSLGLWELPEIYYEDCIRHSPNTNIAKTCYKLFERNTFEAYTGSAGVFIPQDQRVLLKELCELSGHNLQCYGE